MISRERDYTVDGKEQTLQVSELCRSKAKETCGVIYDGTCGLLIEGESI